MQVFSPQPLTPRKSAQDRDPRIIHINQWEQLSNQKRDDALGTNFFQDTQEFFNLSSSQVAPRFRPAIRMPELQILCMREANDLSEFQPQAYIYSQDSDDRLDDLEKAFKAQWHEMFVPYHLLFAFVASQFQGTGWLQFGIDPFAKNNRGRMWTKWRDSKYVHPDPNMDYTMNWSYLIVDDWVHLDEVKRQFPERAKWLPKQSSNVPVDVRNEAGASGFRLPDGPWKAMPPFDNISSAKGNASRRRTTFCLDYSRELIGELPKDPNESPKYRWTYPRGRVIVDCEDVVLVDGQIPFRWFPLVPIWATPPLFGPWAVPPTRYTSSLQDLAERVYSQTYENFYRLNNGIWLIPESADIAQGKFGGIPGEKCTYKGDKPPQQVTPPAFPDSATKMPEQLLQKQRELHGFTQARQGNPGSGNLSPDLFDAAVLRGQSMTQLRGRLASMSVLQLAKLICYSMLEYLPAQMMANRDGSKIDFFKFKPPGSEAIDNYEFLLDDGSFHVKSQAVVSRIAEMLLTKGQIPLGTGLEMVGYPDAAKVGEEQQTQQALAAITAVASGKGKK
jgi:hypothetical protein